MTSEGVFTMAAALVDDRPLTEQDAREALQWLTQHIEESQERMRVYDAEIARLKAETAVTTAESAEIMRDIHASIARIKAIKHGEK